MSGWPFHLPVPLRVPRHRLDAVGAFRVFGRARFLSALLRALP